MNDEEKLVWMLTYTIAVSRGTTDPNLMALRAVEDFQQAQRHFSEDHYPPETWAKDDVPY